MSIRVLLSQINLDEGEYNEGYAVHKRFFNVEPETKMEELIRRYIQEEKMEIEASKATVAFQGQRLFPEDTIYGIGYTEIAVYDANGDPIEPIAIRFN